MKKYLFFLFISFLSIGYTQNYSFKKKQSIQKGALYFYWGYNRSIYTKSDIQFTGPGYNFTIHNALAHDKPETNIKTYFNPKTLSVPQFNIRLGYTYKPHWDVSIGYDHMKYVMTDNQSSYISGTIDDTSNAYLGGVYDNDLRLITENALHYENSNGLNYISVQINNTEHFYRTKNRKLYLQRRIGLGIGGVITQTDFNWDNEDYHTDLVISGFGASIHTGLRADFFQRFFVQTNWSAGYINLPNLNTISNSTHRAKQQFIYADWQIVAGIFFYSRQKNGCGSCPDWD